MLGLLDKWNVPGGALAVARGRRLLLARGYGLANRERNAPVEPASLFRLASLSKTITAVAVLRLVQDGRFTLDDKVLPLLGELGPRPDRITDPRVHAMTVRHLLQHAGGFNRDRSGDVVFMPRAGEAARRQGAQMPPDCPTIVRDTLERKLDFAPGERWAYSNVGYCMLGRIVERVSGTSYESYVRTHVLIPANADGLRLGRTLQAAEGEVTYYDYRDARNVTPVPGLGVRGQVPQPYGQFALETMDAFGGWIGSPVDYLRFVLAIEGRRSPPLLDGRTLAWMNTPSGLAEQRGTDDEFGGKGHAYGLGIRVTPVARGHANLWHGGSLPGTSTLAMRTPDGLAWVVAFNSRPKEKSQFRADVLRGMADVSRKISKWPDGDLFGR